MRLISIFAASTSRGMFIGINRASAFGVGRQGKNWRRRRWSCENWFGGSYTAEKGGLLYVVQLLTRFHPCRHVRCAIYVAGSVNIRHTIVCQQSTRSHSNIYSTHPSLELLFSSNGLKIEDFCAIWRLKNPSFYLQLLIFSDD